MLYRGGRDQAENQIQGLPDLMIRLDIWHFMRRIALGCTTDAHQLYPIFMSRLSACIFEWDAADVSMLRKAKRELLLSQGWPALTDEDVNKHLTREELALHCRRRTCGEETTILLLERVLTELLSSKGNDSWVFLYGTEKGWNTSGVSRRSTLSVSKTPLVLRSIQRQGA